MRSLTLFLMWPIRAKENVINIVFPANLQLSKHWKRFCKSIFVLFAPLQLRKKKNSTYLGKILSISQRLLDPVSMLMWAVIQILASCQSCRDRRLIKFKKIIWSPWRAYTEVEGNLQGSQSPDNEALIERRQQWENRRHVPWESREVCLQFPSNRALATCTSSDTVANSTVISQQGSSYIPTK